MSQADTAFPRTGLSCFLHPVSHQTWAIVLNQGQLNIFAGQLEQPLQPISSEDLQDLRSSEANTRLREAVARQEAAGYVEVASEKAFFPKTLPRLRQLLTSAGLGQPVWLPETESAEVLDWGNGSYYGGASWFEDQPWPFCPSCKAPLMHLLQLDLAQLPAGFDFPLRTGLVKIFACAHGEPTLQENKPQNVVCSAPDYHAVYVSAAQKGLIVGYTLPALPLRLISSWEPLRPEFPVPASLQSLPLEDDAHALYAWERLLKPRPGDKLGGCPHWRQEPESFSCPKCSQPERLLFQLDSQDQLPADFNGMGLGQVWLCPEHPDQLRFARQSEV